MKIYNVAALSGIFHYDMMRISPNVWANFLHLVYMILLLNCG